MKKNIVMMYVIVQMINQESNILKTKTLFEEKKTVFTEITRKRSMRMKYRDRQKTS